VTITLEKLGLKAVGVVDWATDIVLEFILIVALTFGLYSLWDSQQVYEAADSANYTAYRPEANDTLSFEELQKINPEVIGWLTVNDTPIDYPITQTDNNEKYVNTNAEGQYTLSGSVFLDYRNSSDFDDFNSILYGHHMEKKMMFGALSDFADKEYFNSHKYGNLFFNGDNHGVEFFALVLTDAYNNNMFSPAISEKENQQEFIDYLFSNAKYLRNISVTTEDKLILLSTCTSDITNGRYILVGKFTDKLHLQEKSSPKPVINLSTWDVQQLNQLEKIPVWLWLAAIAVLFVLLLVIDGKVNLKRKINHEK